MALQRGQQPSTGRRPEAHRPILARLVMLEADTAHAIGQREKEIVVVVMVRAEYFVRLLHERQVRCQLLKPEFVQWMVRTGCQWVNIGAESGSQAVLDSMHKDQKDWQIEWSVRNLAEFAPNMGAMWKPRLCARNQASKTISTAHAPVG